METTSVETPLGPIPIRHPAGVLGSSKPLALAITGAWAEAQEMIRLPAVVGPAWDAAVMRLPGNGTPQLSETSVAAWGAAADGLVEAAFPGRPVVIVGVSVGALVALAARHRQVRRVVAVEPPLVMEKLWPMAAVLRRRWREAPDERPFIEAVFGLQGETQAARDYRGLFSGAAPSDVILGGIPLFPERPLARFPSLVDAPEREWLAGQPNVTLHVAAQAGHAVQVFAETAVRNVLVGALAKALAP